MDPHKVPSVLHVEAMGAVCRDTVEAWLWYCDFHDSHGNADTEEEANEVAYAHKLHHLDDEDECDIIVWYRQPHERT